MKPASLLSTTPLAGTFVVLFALSACSNTTGSLLGGTGTSVTGLGSNSSYAAGTTSSMTVSDLVSQLTAQGDTVRLTGQQVQQPFFNASGQEMQIDGEMVQAYQYGNPTSAQTDAGNISSDGMSINGTGVSWAGPPHFYQKGNLLVLYVGSTPQILQSLSGVLGPQIAGANTASTNTGTQLPSATSASPSGSTY